MLITVILILLVILVLVLVLILTTRMVRVVNSASQPVPITGTAGIVGPVTVGNSPANPVPVRETERPALQPFVHIFHTFGFNNGEDRAETEFVPIPAGKRLVLEDVSVGAILDAGQKLEIELVRVGVGGEHNRHGIAVSHQVTFPAAGGNPTGTDFLAGGRPIRIYLEPGEKLTAAARRNSTISGAFIDMVVYGYFIDLP